MESRIEFFVVCFLEADVCSDLLLLQKSEVVFALRRDLDVYSADGVAVPVGLVNFSDRVSVVFNVRRSRFAADDEKSFVSHFEEESGLVLDLFVGKYRTFECGVVLSERAVNAVVCAYVAKVERSKEDYSFAINNFFCFSCSLKNLVALFFVFDVEQYRSVFEVKPFELHCAVEHFVDLTVGDFLVDKAVKFLSVDKNLFSVQ